ncbi:hypothetical protein, partial [Kitasatospora aureofaciens]|uniref:hypothetical protein n=1 Tax=Kitasatospora aureofaciens TaxID=1894 RepID=UPI0018E2B41E
MTAQLNSDPSARPSTRPTARPHRRGRAGAGRCDPAGRRPRHPRAVCDGTARATGATGPARHDARALPARVAHQLVHLLTGPPPSGQLMGHTS